MRLDALIGTAAAALLTSTSAFAVVGGEADRFAPNERTVRVADANAQSALNQSPAWQDFLARNGSAWSVLWDEATQTPVRFWGEGWDVDPAALSSKAAAFRLGKTILAQEAALLGTLSLDDLEPLVVDDRQGITTVTYARTWRGLPVEGALVSLRFKNNRFVMGQFESMPDIDATLRVDKAGVASTDARSLALAEMGWVANDTRDSAIPALVVYPVPSAHDVSYRLAWKLELASTAFPSRRHVYVDAQSPELLGFREQVRFLGGEVHAEHDDRWPENGLTTSPMPFVETQIGGTQVNADFWGGIEADGPGTVTWTAGSRYFEVRTADGEGLAMFSGELTAEGDVVMAVPGEELDDDKRDRVLAQIDTHVGAHQARARALRINPNFGWAGQEVEATVNSSEMTCNAWFDGDINFVQEADGCNNTGRVMDVVSHEYGHGFHAYSIIQGAGAFDGALSEGMGDYLAATITGDPATARGFFVGSDAPLRDIELNRVWPEDIGEIHQTGRIIAGALWDTRKALIDALGETEGIDLADQLFWAAASRATDIPTSYPEALLMDDDNGNLADGTPNQCIIDEAFGLHGLGPAADDTGLFSVEHASPTQSIEVAASIELSAQVALSRPACTTGEISAVRLSWSRGSDDFETLTMDAAGDGEFVASLPGADAGTEVRYFIEALDENGDVAGMMPRGSISDPWYAVFVGGGDVLFEADFEDDDGGFSHELLQGNADSEGADDWQWGQPGGNSGDPAVAFSGDNVWGNDLSPEENWNGAYQPNVHNILRSPSIDVSGGYDRVYLQFRRWLTVEDGFWDQADVTVNGISVWSQLAGSNQNDASDHHEDMHWALRTYDITDLVAADDTVQIAWELFTDGGLQMGGWNLDDVKVFGMGAAPEAEVPADGLAGDGSGCACSSTGTATPTWALLLLPVAGLLRRRRA